MEYNVSKVPILIMMADSGCAVTGEGKKRMCNFLLSTQDDINAVTYKEHAQDLYEKGRINDKV